MEAVSIAFDSTIESYSNWQGTFFSIFLMYLHPGIISLGLYRLILFLMFTLGVVAPCIAAFTLNKYYLKADKKYIWIILAAFIFVITQYMPSIYQAYYWYNSTVFYQFTLSIAFLYIAAFTKYRHTKKKATKGLLIASLIIMNIMVAGSNFPLGLMFAAAFTIYIIVAFIKKYEMWKTDVIIYAVFMAIFLINVLAPGNGARHGAYSINLGLVGSAVASVRDMVIELPTWITSTITLGLLCTMLPFGHKIVKNSKIKFVHPAIAGMILIFLLLAQYYPVEYGLGSKGPARVENLRFITLTLGMWLFFINMFGYMHKKEQLVNKYIAIVLAIALITIPLSDIGINEFTSYKMADQIANGELSEFGEVTSYEIAQLESDDIRYVDYSSHITNEFLQPQDHFWFESGIWDYYRKAPKRD
jgi:hypothetical protein